MAAFERDPSDWLRRFSPDEWIRAALGELKRAEAALATHDGRGGVAGLKRAAGMALNGVLLVAPREGYGRSYVDHLQGLAADSTAPEAARAAARTVKDATPPGAKLVTLRGPSTDDRLVEAAKDVIAHAYALVKRAEGEGGS